MGFTVAVTDRCSGHGQCFIYCPEVFVPDEEGFATVPDQAAAAANEDGVRRALGACPEHAIEVTE